MGELAIEPMGFPCGLDFSHFMPPGHDKNDGFVSIFRPSSTSNLSHLQHPPCDDSAMIEGDLVDPLTENFPEGMPDDEESDEDMDLEELERRMWRDRLKLKRLKEQQISKNKDLGDAMKHRQSQEQARRKKMSRAQDGILKYMLKMMEVCKAQGFVYGIIPEKGKPVSGASDNLRGWWKEKVRFDRNGPAAIANSSCSEYDVEGVDDDDDDDDRCEEVMKNQDPIDMNSVFNPCAGSGNEEFIKKRAAMREPEMMLNQGSSFNCENTKFPRNEYQSTRNNHMYLNMFPTNQSAFLGSSGFQLNENKPQILLGPQLLLNQPKPASVNLQPAVTNASSPFGISGLGLPGDGHKLIADLMSQYDSNMNHGKVPNEVQKTDTVQLSNEAMSNFFGSGNGVGGSFFDEANNLQLCPFQEDFEQMDQVYQTQPTDMCNDFRYGSSFTTPAMEFSMSRGVGNWFF
ncbi:hypothetical protein M5K25_001018 [Dendrobium thyrsiflorum]|uniref:Ethylene insensitive 3-like DNA-binding domain-containing protein n=1 Tax=Dendrobium thyrsiflorum TaxID=117978 RepID=A0ABD0VYD9_DENTH